MLFTTLRPVARAVTLEVFTNPRSYSVTPQSHAVRSEVVPQGIDEKSRDTGR